MKLVTRPLVPFVILLLGTSVFLGGCATAGKEPPVKTAGTMQEVSGEIRGVIALLDATGLSLAALVNAEEAGLKNSFDIYSGELARLDGEGQRVILRLKEIKSLRKEYFAEWEKRDGVYTNTQVRLLTEERRVRLAEMYERVPAAGYGAKGAYKAYLADLKKIRQYLSGGLTPDRVKAMAPVIRKSVRDLGVLKTALDPVLVALDEIQVELFWGK